jgi:hypothetical protein
VKSVVQPVNFKPSTTTPVKNTNAIVNPSSGGGGGYSAEAQAQAQAQAQQAQAEAQRASMLKSMEDYLKNSSDSMFKQQEAGFMKTRDEQINGIKSAFDEAVKTGQMSIDEANQAYDGAVKQLDANLYRDSQLTNLTSFDRGLQNSQQMIALQQGDVNRKNVAQTEYATERTRRVSALNDRIASITKQKDIDVNQANTDFNYNVTGARAQADMQLNDGMFQLKQAEYDRMASLAQALASRSFNGGGGGGGSKTTKATPTYDVGDTTQMNNNFNEFVASKQTTAIDDYYNRMNTIFTPKAKTVMQTPKPILPIPSLKNNPTLTAYEKMKIMGG